ncbi:MAG TPA: hypothetical protein VLZ12_06400 [Verrucomicrobiae bacterium]|nr:hypothetical protein [Verrucomicrobiae bacterium]
MSNGMSTTTSTVTIEEMRATIAKAAELEQIYTTAGKCLQAAQLFEFCLAVFIMIEASVIGLIASAEEFDDLFSDARKQRLLDLIRYAKKTAGFDADVVAAVETARCGRNRLVHRFFTEIAKPESSTDRMKLVADLEAIKKGYKPRN